MAMHPCGDHLIVGTQHKVIRLYDVNTMQCFVGSVASNQHSNSITSVKWSQDGRVFASSSKDGSIKLWDGVSNKCFNTFNKAHDGLEVCSVSINVEQSVSSHHLTFRKRQFQISVLHMCCCTGGLYKERQISPFIGKELRLQAVGAYNESVFDCLYGSRLSRQARIRSSSRL